MTSDQDAGLNPWEQPGAVRRDCEPHRATLLYQLSDLEEGFGYTALLLGLPALAGIPFGVWVGMQARRDLKLMHAGCMLPEGEAQTRRALAKATKGLRLSMFGLVGWVVMACFLWLWLLA